MKNTVTSRLGGFLVCSVLYSGLLLLFPARVLAGPPSAPGNLQLVAAPTVDASAYYGEVFNGDGLANLEIGSGARRTDDYRFRASIQARSPRRDSS